MKSYRLINSRTKHCCDHQGFDCEPGECDYDYLPEAEEDLEYLTLTGHKVELVEVN